MPDEHQAVPTEHQLVLREAGQARTDFASIETDLEFLMRRGQSATDRIGSLAHRDAYCPYRRHARDHWSQELLGLLPAVRPQLSKWWPAFAWSCRPTIPLGEENSEGELCQPYLDRVAAEARVHSCHEKG